MPGVSIIGNRNTVLASNIKIMGDNNDCTASSTGSIIVSNNYVANRQTTIIGGYDVNASIITVDLETVMITEFTAPYDLAIETVDILTTITTYRIKVNAGIYTLGELILAGDRIEVEAFANTTLNLNIYR
jgi:hypothetical protein